MKKAICIILSLIMILSFMGCSNNLKIKEPSSSLNGVTVTLNSLTAEKLTKKAINTVFVSKATIRNDSEKDIMSVHYKITITDKDGNELYSWSPSYNGQDKPLTSGSSTSHESGTQHNLEGKKAYSAKVEVIEIKTAEELPPKHLPEVGKPLYQALANDNLSRIKEELPVSITTHIDKGGAGTTAVFEGDTLQAAVDAFCKIKIDEEVTYDYTDNYNWMEITFQDGTSVSISIDLDLLVVSVYGNVHLYKLSGLSTIWDLTKEYGTQD